jgi:hypothetical protein
VLGLEEYMNVTKERIGRNDNGLLAASGVYPNISIDHVISLLVVIEEEDGVENEEGE